MADERKYPNQILHSMSAGDLISQHRKSWCSPKPTNKKIGADCFVRHSAPKLEIPRKLLRPNDTDKQESGENSLKQTTQLHFPYRSPPSQTIESVSHRIYGGTAALKDVASSVITRQCNFIVDRLVNHFQGDYPEPDKKRCGQPQAGQVTYTVTVDLTWRESSEPCNLEVRMACTDESWPCSEAVDQHLEAPEGQPASMFKLLPPKPWIESPRSATVAAAEAAISSPLERLHEGLRLVPTDGSLLGSW